MNSIQGSALFKLRGFVSVAQKYETTRPKKVTTAAAVGDGSRLIRSSMLGFFLADFACGIDSEELRYLLKMCHPEWCPPEPIKTIAANIRMSLEEFNAKDEI